MMPAPGDRWAELALSRSASRCKRASKSAPSVSSRRRMKKCNHRTTPSDETVAKFPSMIPVMVIVSVLYPRHSESRFDHDYYLRTHVPLVESRWGGMGL